MPPAEPITDSCPRLSNSCSNRQLPGSPSPAAWPAPIPAAARSLSAWPAPSLRPFASSLRTLPEACGGLLPRPVACRKPAAVRPLRLPSPQLSPLQGSPGLFPATRGTNHGFVSWVVQFVLEPSTSGLPLTGGLASANSCGGAPAPRLACAKSAAVCVLCPYFAGSLRLLINPNRILINPNRIE